MNSNGPLFGPWLRPNRKMLAGQPMPPTPRGRDHRVGLVHAVARWRAHRRRVSGRGGVGFSWLAKGTLGGGVGQGDGRSDSPRRSSVDELVEAALGGGVPATARADGGRRRSGKDPAALVSGGGG
jgi:hypothetical protein